MTTDLADASLASAMPYQGEIIIEWPQPRDGAQVLDCSLVTVTDTATGEPISTVADFSVHCGIDGFVTAELTQLIGPDRKPARQHDDGCFLLAIGADKKPVLGTFRYLVAGMRVQR